MRLEFHNSHLHPIKFQFGTTPRGLHIGPEKGDGSEVMQLEHYNFIASDLNMRQGVHNLPVYVSYMPV
jgi:hypothetical protein